MCIRDRSRGCPEDPGPGSGPPPLEAVSPDTQDPGTALGTPKVCLTPAPRRSSSFFLLSAHPHRRHDALKLLFKGERVQVGGVDIVVIVLDCQMQKHLLPACECHVCTSARVAPCLLENTTVL